MKLVYLIALVASGIVAISCSSSDGYSCGPGTRAAGSECVVAGGSAGDASAEEAGQGGAGTEHSAGAAGLSSAAAGEGGSADDGPVQLVTEPLDCGSRNITGATVITEPITVDTTWRGVIYLPQGLTVRNEPTLTIAPGTKIIVGKAGLIDLGVENSAPTLRALGTAAAPIEFCGETAQTGSWAGVIFRSHVQPSSLLRNVLFSDAGAMDAALILEMPLVVQGVQVRNSALAGVRAVGFGAGSAALTVADSGGVPLTATAAKGIELPPQSSFTGNHPDVIDVGFTSLDTDVTLHDFGIPYRQMADVNGTQSSTPPVITFEPGVVYQMKHQTLLNFGSATVHARGTSAQPIVFQGVPCEQDPGVCTLVPSDHGHVPGGRLVLNGGTGFELTYVELHSFGWTKQRSVPPFDYLSYGALTVATDAPLKLDHVTLTLASGWGIQLAGKGSFTADSQALDVNTQPRFSTYIPVPLSLACGFLMTLPLDTQVSGEPRTNVTCFGTGSLKGTLPVAAGPYILSGFEVDAGGALTLQPGTVLRFSIGTTLRVKSGGTLTALGNADSNIQFLEDTTPYTTIGNWNGLIVESGGTALLDYALLDSGGASEGANVTAQSPITLTHSVIRNSANWGLQKASTDDTDYLTPNTFSNNVTGDISDL